MSIPIIGPILEALNFFTLMMMLITLVFRLGLGLFLTAYLVPAARIFYCIERDKRGLELNIAEEDPLAVKTKSKPALKFWKVFGSYEFPARFGKKISTYFGKEGTAYIWKLISGDVEKVFDTAEDLIKTIWGETFYATVPEEQKQELKENSVLVTVKLEEGLTPEGFTPITETDIEDAGDRNFLTLWAKGVKGVLGTPIGDRLMTMGAGGLIVLVVSILMGWIEIVGTG